MGGYTPHNVENYTISKGVLSIAEFSGGAPGSYDDMGNAPTAEVEVTLERLPHYTSREKMREKDKNPVISSEYIVRFSLDEHAGVNLSKYLMGVLENDGVTIYAMQNPNKEFALKFEENNPEGPNKTWNFWKCTLAPAGPLQLVGDGSAWAVMEFQAEGLTDRVNHPESPYFTVVYGEAAAPETTTTSS